MKKDAFYFPHFCNARNDAKIIKLRRVLGLEGYAMYFMLLEVLREQTSFKYPLSGIEDLAFEWHISKEKLLSVISHFDLFQIDNENFFSTKLVQYLQPYFEKTERAASAARIRWEKTKLTLLESNANADANADTFAMQVKESKVKKSKVNKSKVNKSIKEEVKKQKPKKEHNFSESEYFDFEKLKNEIGEKYQIYDLQHYYDSMQNYSESKNKKYVNWLATCRSWIKRDIDENKPRLCKNANSGLLQLKSNELVLTQAEIKAGCKVENGFYINDKNQRYNIQYVHPVLQQNNRKLRSGETIFQITK